MDRSGPESDWSGTAAGPSRLESEHFVHTHDDDDDDGDGDGDGDGQCDVSSPELR